MGISKQNKAIFAGSFDPPTRGHLSIIKRANTIFDQVIIMVANNFNKKMLFTVQERMQLLQQSLQEENLDLQKNIIKQLPSDELLVRAAKRMNIGILIRGIRESSDFDFEFQWTGMNFSLSEDIDIIYFPSRYFNQFISSSFVKEVASLNGDISKFVSSSVASALKKKFLCK